MTKKNREYSRRDFLKVIGATSGVAAVGCTQQPIEKIIPYVNQPNEVIPGVATWYSGTCDECDAGCGVHVRTREGRVVKVEGNPEHPINAGGLCARGQAGLQSLYDPDRIREPLKREKDASFTPISWEEAISEVSAAFKSLSKEQAGAILSGRLTGSIASLVDELKSSVDHLQHVEFDLLGRDCVDEAARRSFGSGIETHFDFSKADVVVSFGADYLETWLSPVEYSKQWAERRTPGRHSKKMSYAVHFEPRLSLTGANADLWVMTKPEVEADLLLGLLKEVVDARKVTADLRVSNLVKGVDVAEIERQAGIKQGLLSGLAKRLLNSKSSLVVSGGASASGANGVRAAELSNVLNVVLGNIGRSVKLVQTARRKTQTSHDAMSELIGAMGGEQSRISALLISGVNPYYSLPHSSGFQKALSKVDFVVSVSSHLDETTMRADIVLPASTSFESWGDSEPIAAVYNLNQPSMQPLYRTQALGDTLIAIAAKLGVRFGEAASFYDYMRDNWRVRIGDIDFEARWLELVQSGGDWSETIPEQESFALRPGVLQKQINKSKEHSSGSLSFIAYPSVNSADGTSANKAWLQELPNPMTTSVWGSWVEVHPETLKRLNLDKDSVVEVRAGDVAISVPVYETKNIHPGVVAVPIGQGHESYGRYATGVGINPLVLLSGVPEDGLLSFMTAGVTLANRPWKEELLVTQGHDYQMGRDIVVTMKASELNGAHKNSHSNADHGKKQAHSKDAHSQGGHGEAKQMYKQMEHPLHKWGMAVDLASCTGCSACVVACQAENNIPVVGRELCAEGRELSWIRMERYFDGSDTRPVSGFLPMMCQHCGNAPCEPVCPVYATYHNEEGLNVMVYNRCVGTRYCSNNCSYKVRKYNWFKYDWPEPLTWQLNPDVTVREVGVMEKCSLCVHRIREVQNNAKNLGKKVADGEIQPACASSCPTKAITFGDLLDDRSEASVKSKDKRAYKILDHHLNTQPAVSYLARVENDSSEGV